MSISAKQPEAVEEFPAEIFLPRGLSENHSEQIKTQVMETVHRAPC